MIRAVQELYAWLTRSGLNPADFKIVLYSDPSNARRAADVLGREADAVSVRPNGQPASEGQICGVPFSIVPFPAEPILARALPRSPAQSSARLRQVTFENIDRVEWTLRDPGWQPTRSYVEKLLASYKELASNQ
jgi:hypothetical protein